MSTNPILELAREFIHYTNKNIFLTGKAGTGKTTFLHSLKETLPKRMAIVAPTGVAAINAGGVTIHSFFQLPFGPYIPDSSAAQSDYKFNRERIKVLKGLDVLVIDEISMVRADTLDAIDGVLRKYRNHQQPFGGVQLLMIGDLHQLPPVVKRQDWQLLQAYYQTPYFFGSRALAESKPIRIELTQIYRQTDPTFVALLNEVRNNQLSEAGLRHLNTRYIPNFNPDEEEGYITLTTHKELAHQINSEKLSSLSSKKHTFKASCDGEFPEHNFPTEHSLELKIGSQVMFVKNDPSRDKAYYNGKIGKVIRVSQDAIFVKCKGDFAEIVVEKATWQNIKYELNTTSKALEEKILGSFTQYPLKLAWAITIHKSQGLTFEKAIIDAHSAFTHGQVYVALSRCKSLEGMVLSAPLTASSIMTDRVVGAYSAEVSNHPPDQLLLDQEKQAFHTRLLFELFDFNEFKSPFYQLSKALQEKTPVVSSELIEAWPQISQTLYEDIYAVADKFRNQLDRLILEANGDVDNPELAARVQKAATYFLGKINEQIDPKIASMEIETDNSELKKITNNALDQLRRSIFVKQKCLNIDTQGFSAQSYLHAKANADIDYLLKQKSTKTIAGTSGQGGKLYDRLKNWRNEKAAEHQVEHYMILNLKTLAVLAKERPLTSKALGKIPGIGKIKLRQFADEILNIIADYSGQKPEDSSLQIEAEHTETDLDETTATKRPTRQITYEAFLQGLTMAEIATQRKLTLGTIESHLTQYITSGQLDIYRIYPAEKIDPILEYCRNHQTRSATEVRQTLGDDYSYSEIRAALHHLQTNG